MNATHDTHDVSTSAGDFDARAVLAAAESAQGSIADRLITPWWYHPALGAIIAALFAVVALDTSTVTMIVVEVVAVVCLGMLVAAYKRITGVWAGFGSAGPRTRRTWILYMVPLVVLLVAAVIWSGRFSWPLVLVLGLAVVAWTTWRGRVIDEALRQEIRSGHATGERVA